MNDSTIFNFNRNIESIKKRDYKNSCSIDVFFEPETTVLTEFQKLIVDCEPEIGKPVLILSGAGSGKTWAIGQRSLKKDLVSIHLHAHSKRKCRDKEDCSKYIIQDKIHQSDCEIVFDPIFDIDTFIEVCEVKKVIGICTPVEFISNIGPRMKGEYTIISGYNANHNPHLDSKYIELLYSLSYKNRSNLLGEWGVYED